MHWTDIGEREVLEATHLDPVIRMFDSEQDAVAAALAAANSSSVIG